MELRSIMWSAGSRILRGCFRQHMGAEFSDVALPFGETEEDARVGRNETGHWPFARAT